MKKIITHSCVAVVFAALLTISSCSKDPLILPYSLDDMSACLVDTPYQVYQVFTFPLNHNDVAAVLNSNSVDLSRVTEARLENIKAVITTGGAVNFDQIANIEVYMKPAGASGEGEQIAYTPSIGAGEVEVGFTVNGAELKTALTEDKVITVKVLNGTNGNGPICISLTDALIHIKARR